jgi:hypothetical protein
MSTTSCEDILENIKLSLLQCKNNKTDYSLEKAINMRKCENIQTYQSSLYATKTQIVLQVPELVSKYSIQYDVQNRIIHVNCLE